MLNHERQQKSANNHFSLIKYGYKLTVAESRFRLAPLSHWAHRRDAIIFTSQKLLLHLHIVIILAGKFSE